MIKDSGLRGRGGADFPTGMKWAFIPQSDSIPQGTSGPGTKPKYLVVNADESEPGTCKDVPLMLADPHALIEGCIITSYAIRANFCAIYVRGEALHCIRRVRHAVQQAYAAGYLGRDVLGSGFDLDIVVHAGAGAYICGEETALLDSLEGRRGAPRLKPPFPATSGLYAAPTVVNNVETIASVPAIVQGGSGWFRTMGTEKSPGPKIYSVSGHVERPGQYEVPLGTTLRVLLELAGGMKDGIALKFWTPGGSSTPLFTAAHLDVPLDFEGAAAAGSMLGTTALMIFNETVSVPWAVMKWTEFYRHESCGKCTPCREGTYWLELTLQRMAQPPRRRRPASSGVPAEARAGSVDFLAGRAAIASAEHSSPMSWIGPCTGSRFARVCVRPIWTSYSRIRQTGRPALAGRHHRVAERPVPVTASP